MYRLLIYGLVTLLLAAVGGSSLKLVSFHWYALLESALILVVSSLVAQFMFSRLYGAETFFESTIITALILFFLFSPPETLSDALVLVLVATLSVASKYLLAFRQRLIFNPAAVTAVIISLTGLGSAIWWIANPFMATFVFVFGILVVRKIRRLVMVGTFALTAVTVILVKASMNGPIDVNLLKVIVLSWPILFMGTIMLTEPLTTPPRYKLQIIYAVLVGLIFTSGLRIGVVSATPEIALVIGNIFAFSTSIRQRLRLRLSYRRELSNGLVECSFIPDRPATFLAGQYADLTVPHAHIDSRGYRRIFTIASSPTEKQVLFGMRISSPSSTFKSALMRMNEGEYIYANYIAGDFVLPNNIRRKLLFIAGGIGVTPFRSMLQSIVDERVQRDIVVLYVCSDPYGFIYGDVMQAAQQYGVRTVYILSSDTKDIPTGWQWETGYIRQELLARYVPDVQNRKCYISGPNAMVYDVKKVLMRAGVKRRYIKTDYFTGY